MAGVRYIPKIIAHRGRFRIVARAFRGSNIVTPMGAVPSHSSSVPRPKSYRPGEAISHHTVRVSWLDFFRADKAVARHISRI